MIENGLSVGGRSFFEGGHGWDSIPVPAGVANGCGDQTTGSELEEGRSIRYNRHV
jgi:hypothetical protein